MLRPALNRTPSSSVKCARSPAAGLTQVELLTILADIILEIPRRSIIGGFARSISFYNRTEDDLPSEIKGRAYWSNASNEQVTAYQIEEGGTAPRAVEYINGTWYYITWLGNQSG